MIRRINNDDINAVMKIWLESNIEAHSFVGEGYWTDNYSAVKEQLTGADVFLYEQDGEILGFVGMVGNYLAGIFVDSAHRCQGIGKILLDYVKKNYDCFTLDVYSKNSRAVNFYLREGLYVTKKGVDETGNEELTMCRKS